jgi:hypothetical protein
MKIKVDRARKEMATATHALQNYAEAFSHIVKSADGREPAWLRTLRQGAFDRFLAAGFPTTRDEDWRFTTVTGFLARSKSNPISSPGPLVIWFSSMACSSQGFLHSDTCLRG